MKTQNLAVMFTDIQGFTSRTSQQTREENAAFLRLHDALLLPVVRAFGGRKVKTIGDALLVVFASPTNSVLCGMAVQDRLWDYNRRAPEADRLDVRVAVNLGEVRVVRSMGAMDVFGDPVNIAARVEGVAEAGEVWFTEAVYLAMNKAEAPAEDMGYRELKGIPERIRLYRAARGRYALSASPPDAAGDPVPQPPYGNMGLARVKGLPPPDPAALLRAARGGAPALDRALDGLGRAAAAVTSLGRSAGPASPRRRRLAGLALLLCAAAAGFVLLGRPRAERLIAAGRLEEARASIETLARERGEGDAQVLYLEGRLEEERARRGNGALGREVFELYARAAVAGSGDALDALARLSGSQECAVRRRAARALGETRSRDALRPLRALAEAEPEEPETSDPLEKVKRFFGAGGRCGAGDLARESIHDIEEGRRVE